MEPRPPMTPRDRRCFAALAGMLAAITVVYEATDGAALRAAEADEPPAAEVWEAPLNQPRLLEAIQLQLEEDTYRADVPLDRELQEVLREACGEHGVPIHLALGLIETESRFQAGADNGVCYGLCQLNRRYFPDFLAPEDNIRCGIAYLGELLNRYGDTAAALTAYNAGHDTGDRTYAGRVLAAAEDWKED